MASTILDWRVLLLLMAIGAQTIKSSNIPVKRLANSQFGQFLNQKSAPYTGGSIIMPPNNQIQASSFQQMHQITRSPPESTTSKPPIVLSHNDSTSHHPASSQSGLNDFFQGLALTQSDESVFQPSPPIAAPGHSSDWFTPSSQSSEHNYIQKDHQARQKLVSTSTDSSNNILQGDLVPSMQKEYPTVQMNSQSAMLNTSDLSNQVIYEGPATAPPTGDYYFSSSEKLPAYEGKASNAWWALGSGPEYERAINLTRDDYHEYCVKSEFLVSAKQRSLCRMHPRVIPIVARGLKMAIDECQSRFASSRWNCSIVLQESLDDGIQVFGDVMRHSNRERSYLNAIIAAGLAHAMTKACSQGELPEECSCDKRIKSRSNKGKIEWVACSDDIDYGARFSRDFTDSLGWESDTIAMINTHNNEVGRRVFKSATDITCTCQGSENGFCQTKRCWRHLGSFTDVGDELMRRYEGATHVQPSNRDPHKLRPVRRGVRKPKRKDLVYIDESPDYCTEDTRLGVLGTRNRRCNSTSTTGPDSCSLLCCGKGYQVFVEEVEEDCNCKFVWCCQVKCEKCKRQITTDVCN